MKNVTPFFHYVIAFLTPVLIRIESFMSLTSQILNNNYIMTGYDIYELIALPVFTLGVFWYYDRKFKKMKNALYEHSETLREDADEISLLVSTMVKRKMRYLRNCINAGRILPHATKWITDEEERLYVKGSKDRQKRIDHYKKILDIEIDENSN